jgi:glycosyltransferase involved in cell wall biosynthesis
LLKMAFPAIKIVWGLRASNMDMIKYDWLNRISHWLETRLSNCPNHIIVNSYAGFMHAKSKGYRIQKMTVVSNGIDTERFIPNEELRNKQRLHWKLASSDILLGFVGRWDPMKDHLNFLAAANLLLKDNPHCKFVCVGKGSPQYGAYLKNHQLTKKLGDRLIWEENVEEVQKIYNAFDVLCQTSEFGEGFSNVIGEAMASGCPVVTTHVGDSALIVGDQGIVVSPRDPEAFANACMSMMAKNPDRNLIRNRIVSNFGLEVLVNKTLDTFKKVLSKSNNNSSNE